MLNYEKMKIAILGTRGIPNHYGGFEQCAEYLALGLCRRGHEVIVYNSHNHPYQKSEWNGVQLVHRYDPEDKLGTAGQFIYDLNCILDLRRRNVDIILQLGYTSSSTWGWLLPKKAVVTTNMDGLEWKRTKYSGRVKRFLLAAESLAIKYSDYLISDSIGIQNYLSHKYQVASSFIPYGADVFTNPKKNVLEEYKLKEYGYDLLIARLEPENSIEIILDGVVNANTQRPFLVIGKHETKFGEYLKNKYKGESSIQFVGGVYDINKLNSIRHYSNIYFHGHTVGGTNPSLLEAMASNSLICANENSFNKYILNEDALYFRTDQDVCKVLTNPAYTKDKLQSFLEGNIQKIREVYSWERIVDQYAEHFEAIKGKVIRHENSFTQGDLSPALNDLYL
jgi:glycosyltransferase involved in cell wall biosynthesis